MEPFQTETRTKTKINVKILVRVTLVAAAIGTIAYAAAVFLTLKRTNLSQSNTAKNNDAVDFQKLALANGMTLLEEGDFAIIKTEIPGANPSGKKYTYLANLGGQTFSASVSKPSTVQFITGKTGMNVMVKNGDSNIEIHEATDFIGYDGKIDKAVKSKIAKNEKVPVIIHLNTPFSKYYEQKDTAANRRLKKTQFDTIKDLIKTRLTPSGKFYELKVINAISAEISSKDIEELNRNKDVKKVELDRKVQAFLDESPVQISAPSAWASLDQSGTSLTGAGKIIAIIDTGVDYQHPDLGGCLGQNCKVMGGYDFVNNDSDPTDDHGHGTHVAATAAGSGFLKGVAPDAKILAYKVLDSGGWGYASAIINAINQTVDPNQDGDPSDRADVASLSLGGDGNPDDAMSQAVDKASEAGVVFTIAAGNSGPAASTISSPATAKSAITVAATCKNSQIGSGNYCFDGPIASFSSRGPLIWNNVDYQKPDISAPGVLICAARWDSSFSYASPCFDNNHIRISGTSMATPHVAGAAALIRQAYPNYSPEQVKQLLKQTAKNLNASPNDQGSGEINLQAAVPGSKDLRFSQNLWNITSDPTKKISSADQIISVTSLSANIKNLSVNFKSDIAGVTFTGSTTSLDVSGLKTVDIAAHLEIDNDQAASGIYYGYIVFSENSSQKGAIPIFISIKPTLEVLLDTVDFGADDPRLSTWRSATQNISVKNLRQDTSQFVRMSISGFSNGISYSGLPSMVVAASRTATIGASLTANNNVLANYIYKGYLNIEGSRSKFSKPAQFAKYHVLSVNFDSFNNLACVHDRQSLILCDFSDSDVLKFYLDSPGNYDLMSVGSATALFENIKENISVAGLKTVNVNRSESKNEIKLTGTDINGNQVSYDSAMVMDYFVSRPDFGISSLIFGYLPIYASNFSSNYKLSASYITKQPAPVLYSFGADVLGLQDKNINITNNASDFKKMEIQYDLDRQIGTTLGILELCHQKIPTGFCGTSYSSSAPLPLPANQIIYSTDKSGIFLNINNFEEPTFSVAPLFKIGTGQRWLDWVGNVFLPFGENKIYNGLGPSWWDARIENYNNTVYFNSGYCADTGCSKAAFIRQDYAIKHGEKEFDYQIYKSGSLVSSGTFPSPSFFGNWGNISSMDLPGPGSYEFRTSFPYKNKNIELTGSVVAKFNTALADPNPPAIKRLYVFSNGFRSEIYDPAASNKFEFELSPVGGSIKTAAASYSTDGSAFTLIALSEAAGTWTANIPSGLSLPTSKISLRLEGIDDLGNSLSYTFQLPKGTAQAAQSLPSDPSSLSATAISSTQIKLNWKDNSDNENMFKIERKLGLYGSWSQIGTAPSNISTYLDSGLTTGKAYYYRVRANNSVGDSKYSNNSNATPEFLAPTELKAVALAGAKINLTWKDNSSDELGFKVERKKGLYGSWIQIIITSANATSFSDTGLTVGNTYYYRVRAYNAVIASKYSPNANAKAY